MRTTNCAQSRILQHVIKFLDTSLHTGVINPRVVLTNEQVKPPGRRSLPGISWRGTCAKLKPLLAQASRTSLQFRALKSALVATESREKVQTRVSSLSMVQPLRRSRGSSGGLGGWGGSGEWRCWLRALSLQGSRSLRSGVGERKWGKISGSSKTSPPSQK